MQRINEILCLLPGDNIHMRRLHRLIAFYQLLRLYDTLMPGLHRLKEAANELFVSWAKEDRQQIVLMGDSVLDNSIWFFDAEQKNHLRMQVQALQPQMQCVNLAVAPSSTFDFCAIRAPWGETEDRKEMFANGEDSILHECEEDDRIYQVENLGRLRRVKLIVLSVGSNDILLNGNKLVGDDLAENMRRFRQRYIANVIEPVNAVTESKHTNVLLVLPYGAPTSNVESFAHEMALTKEQFLLIATTICKIILSLALQYGYSVIDLNHSFDTEQSDLYLGDPKNPKRSEKRNSILAKTPRPSEKGSLIIAKLISHTAESYKPTIVYSLKDTNEIQAQPLDQAFIDKFSFQ